MRRFLFLLLLCFFVAGCATPPPEPASFSVNLPYIHAYKRIKAGAESCFGNMIIDANYYTDKPFAEVKINTRPMGDAMIINGLVHSMPDYSTGLVTVTIRQTNEVSLIELSDNLYKEPVVQWLNKQYHCDIVKRAK